MNPFYNFSVQSFISYEVF